MLKRIFAAISALLTILFAALGVQWIDRSRKNHWDLLPAPNAHIMSKTEPVLN